MSKSATVGEIYTFLEELWRRYRVATTPLSKEEEEDWQPFGM
jgi:hypothetical protein